jgi:methanogenic corrinoid protein MtbC1
MSEDQVKQRVLEMSETNFEYSSQVDALVVAMIELDELAFEKTLASSIRHSGFEETFLNIVFPFLNKLGILWQTAVIKPVQEHFISNLVRQKLHVAIDSQPLTDKTDNKYRHLLFLPEKEQHELTLLFTNYVLRSRGYHTLYLGPSVPVKDLVEVAKDYDPDYIFTLCISSPGVEKVQPLINQLSENFPESQIIFSGKQAIAANPELPENATLFQSLQETVIFINDLETPRGGGLPPKMSKHAAVYAQY